MGCCVTCITIDRYNQAINQPQGGLRTSLGVELSHEPCMWSELGIIDPLMCPNSQLFLSIWHRNHEKPLTPGVRPPASSPIPIMSNPCRNFASKSKPEIVTPEIRPPCNSQFGTKVGIIRSKLPSISTISCHLPPLQFDQHFVEFIGPPWAPTIIKGPPFP